MKQFLILLLACVFSLGFQMPHRTDFSGKWRLDLKKSKNLPDAFKHVSRYVMDIRQNDDSLVSLVSMEGMGQSTSLPPFVCVFGHKDDYTEDTLRLAKHWISSEWTTTGTKLIVHKKNAVQISGVEQTSTETDVWQLNNRSTLILHVTMKYEKDGSSRSEERIFHRTK